jgi:hypothetical protein
VRIPDHDRNLKALLRELRPPANPSANGHAPQSPARSDEEVIAKARSEKNGKFERLWNGDLSDYNGDHSAADNGFIYKLYYYTQDEEQIRRIHGQSKLARDKSLDRDGYLQYSIDNARENVTDRYRWERTSTSSSLIGDRSWELPEDHENLVQSIKATTLRGLGKPKPREWVVANHIWERHAACWYGEGGVAKSLLAMYLGTCIASPEFDTWMGTPIKTAPVLCLDFELDAGEQHRRLYETAQGLGLDDVPENLYYLGATEHPASVMFAVAAEEVKRLGIKLVIVDSVGFAVEGDAEVARDILSFHRNYLEPIKAAGASPLLIDHQAKIMKGEKYSDKTAFGSVYKTNAVRSMFQVRGGKREDGDGITATFRHTKNNFGPKVDEFSVDVKFGIDRITFERLEEAIPNPDREPTSDDHVLDALEELGKATAPQLIEHTAMKDSTVRNAVTRLAKEGKIEPTGEKDGRAPYYQRTSQLPTPIRELEVEVREESESPGDAPTRGARESAQLPAYMRWWAAKRILGTLHWRLDAANRRARREKNRHDNDPARYHDMPINRKINLRAWVRENVSPRQVTGPQDSYFLKHVPERFFRKHGYPDPYISNAEIKGALIEAGYEPVDEDEHHIMYFRVGPTPGSEWADKPYGPRVLGGPLLTVYRDLPHPRGASAKALVEED